jgi:hypothetical protein
MGTMIEPRPVHWRMLTDGAQVWAPFGEHGWRAGTVVAWEKPAETAQSSISCSKLAAKGGASQKPMTHQYHHAEAGIVVYTRYRVSMQRSSRGESQMDCRAGTLHALSESDCFFRSARFVERVRSASANGSNLICRSPAAVKQGGASRCYRKSSSPAPARCAIEWPTRSEPSNSGSATTTRRARSAAAGLRQPQSRAA